MDSTTEKTSERGYWLPDISPRQEEIMKLSTKFNLITGPRMSSKTRGILHTLMLHAWEHEYARIAMVGRTQTASADGGPWAALNRYIIPEWVKGTPMEIVRPERMDGSTHKRIVEVSNQHGGTTIIQLDSLAIESDVDDRFKGKEYSFIYLVEADNFQFRYSYDVIQECLRGVPGLKPNDYRLFLDCNPPKDGEDHWLHALFFKFRLMDLDDLSPKDEEDLKLNILEGNDKEEALLSLKELQKELSVMQFTVDDNIYLTAQQKRAQWAKYAHDKDLLDRYYYGKWVKAAGESVFSQHFRPAIHVNDVGKDPRNPEIFLPEENCSHLLSGWDIGGSNNAAVVIEQIAVERIVLENGVEKLKEVPAFKILDEFVSIGENVSVSALTEHMMEKLVFWQGQCNGKIWFRHISDRSAFDKYNNIGDNYEYQEVLAESGGQIELERGPVKKKGSVQARVNLFKKLLFQDRLFVSSKCVGTIEMFRNIKAGKYKALDEHSKYKHVFDAASYAICLICFAEMEDLALMLSGQKNSKTRTIIST